MALDFGDAGLFDPLPPASRNGKKSKFDSGDNNTDDENDNVHGNSGWKDDEVDGKSPSNNGEDEDDDIEDWPSAPPLDILDCIKGYEMVSFDATSVPPPPFEEEEEPAAIVGPGPAAGGEENQDAPKEGAAGLQENKANKVRQKVDLNSICYWAWV